MPGSASGADGGAATLDVDSSSQLAPLTVDFDEPQRHPSQATLPEVCASSHRGAARCGAVYIKAAHHPEGTRFVVAQCGTARRNAYRTSGMVWYIGNAERGVCDAMLHFVQHDIVMR
jgi:hypothetical protein